MELRVQSLIGFEVSSREGTQFRAMNPATGQAIPPDFHTANTTDVHRAAKLAESAFRSYSRWTGKRKAILLKQIASAIEALGQELIDRTALETALGHDRLKGELARTCNQLRLFASVVEEGSWVNARIDRADPNRKPLPKPDIRSMLRPIGPVAVFGASNFPLAFSVAGGDTASALAAGNPVIVKAHPAHPGTSELAGRAIVRAVDKCKLPRGVFALLFDSGIGVGVALMKLAAARPQPIPCYAEMGSTNPLFVLPRALRQRGAELAKGVQTSFTLGSGQFCTKPGLEFVPQQDADEFVDALRSGVAALGAHGMLTPSIAKRYNEAVAQRRDAGTAEWVAGFDGEAASHGAAGSAAVFSVPLAEFAANHELEEEIFGPTT